MTILFTICGRAGSKGLANKNLKSFLGYALPYYTLSIIDLFIKSNKEINCDIVLNTDSVHLMDLFRGIATYPIEMINREAALSGDSVPKIAVIKDSYHKMKSLKSRDYDMVVDLDITSPIRMLSDLEALVHKKMTSHADVVFSVTESRRNPYFNMVMKTEEGYKRVITSDFNARQEAPEILDMNASMYAYSPKFLEESKGIFDGRCDVITMYDTAVLDIDTENDFLLMEIIAKHLFGINSKMNQVKENISLILSKK